MVKSLLFLALTATIAGCTATSPLQPVHDDLLSKFTYVYQPPEADEYIQHSGHRPFTGDCDDYYSAARNRLRDLGYQTWGFQGYTMEGEFHVVLCAEVEGRRECLDPNYEDVRSSGALSFTYHRHRVIMH